MIIIYKKKKIDAIGLFQINTTFIIYYSHEISVFTNSFFFYCVLKIGIFVNIIYKCNGYCDLNISLINIR